jgi:hypothetical protein
MSFLRRFLRVQLSRIPFFFAFGRYTNQAYKCSQDALFYKICDAFDASPTNPFSVVRHCGRFGQSCALACTGDKNAPSCLVAGTCTCLDTVSFAPLHNLHCHGYAQTCNSTEWRSQCGLYTATCKAATVNQTSSRFVQPEYSEVTCECLAGITPSTTAVPCHAAGAALPNDGTTLRACTFNEARSACGVFAASCQYHIPTAAAISATCACNASSVTLQSALGATTSCPGPTALRSCTPAELARCEHAVSECTYNVTLGQSERLLNRSLCFPDHYEQWTKCDTALALRTCGPGYVACRVQATYNQEDGFYNVSNATAECTCNALFANLSTRLGYTCVNETTVVRPCSATEFQQWCATTSSGVIADNCFAFDYSSTLVPGSCDTRFAARNCTDDEYAIWCPLGSQNRSETDCQVACAASGTPCYGIVANASCIALTPAPIYVAPPLLPANATGYPRECTDAEYSAECAHDIECETVLGECLAYDNTTLVDDNGTWALSEAIMDVLQQNLSYAEALAAFANFSEPVVLTLDDNSTLGYNVTYNMTYFNESVQVCTNQTFMTQCTRVPRRVRSCVAYTATNYTCDCQPGFGPLNPRYSITTGGFVRVDARDSKFGRCEGLVRNCSTNEEIIIFGGIHAVACEISCNEADPTANCVIVNATCDAGRPALPVNERVATLRLTANELSAFFPINVSQPCGTLGFALVNQSVYDAQITLDGSLTVNITAELQRRCGPYVDRGDFLIFDCNTTHSLCEPSTRYAVYTLGCYCRANTYAGDLLTCEHDYYVRECTPAEKALVPRDTFDAACQRSYVCKRMCYPATTTQPEVCFRHAPDPCKLFIVLKGGEVIVLHEFTFNLSNAIFVHAYD